MTRINTGFPVNQLNTRHLLSEHREIKRIPNLVSKGRYNLKNTPKEFTLGKGHMAFFYNKLKYLKYRYDKIYNECIRRGFKVTYYGNAWDDVPKELMNNYNPTKKAKKLIRQRIHEKLTGTYMGKK